MQTVHYRILTSKHSCHHATSTTCNPAANQQSLSIPPPKVVTLISSLGQLFSSHLRKSGILNFNDSPLSDHRALFADYDEQALIQGTTTDLTAPSQQLLRLNNPSQCKTYLQLVHKYFLALSTIVYSSSSEYYPLLV